jgi:metal-responsive CopG/Arc/MetJ family transcriptional regulator
MSSKSNRKNYTTGVSLEPEVVRSLDELAAQSGLNRSWVLNTIVREYLRLAQMHPLTGFPSREAIIRL